MTITIQQLADKIRALGTSRPYNKYGQYLGSCYYDKGTCTDGTTGCIVGQALKELGVPDEKLSVEGTVCTALYKLGIPEDNDALLIWCRRVQVAQDTGETWGVAIELADKEMTNAGQHRRNS